MVMLLVVVVYLAPDLLSDLVKSLVDMVEIVGRSEELVSEAVQHVTCHGRLHVPRQGFHGVLRAW